MVTLINKKMAVRFHINYTNNVQCVWSKEYCEGECSCYWNVFVVHNLNWTWQQIKGFIKLADIAQRILHFFVNDCVGGELWSAGLKSCFLNSSLKISRQIQNIYLL